MHYHCEIILPPGTADVEKAVEQVLDPFDENGKEDAKHTFWDFYAIGGRYAGDHATSRFDPQILERFDEELRKRKVTISGIVWGKEELQPADQIPMVDALWREMFPGSGLEHCPLFLHSNPNNAGSLTGDVCTVKELGAWQACYRLIVAGPQWDGKAHSFAKLQASHMVSKQMWNGVSHVDTDFDGKVLPEIERWNAKAPEFYSEQYASMVIVTPEHIAVTVDYHS